jgi:Macroglobulin domain MG4
LKLSVEEKIPVSFGKVPVRIDATYTFGGDVSGTASIIVTNYFYGKVTFKKTINIVSGSATLDIDIADDLGTNEEYTIYDISVFFNDPFTGSNFTDVKRFSIYTYTYNFHTKPESVFRPGTPYRFTVTLERYDGSPAPAGTQIRIISTSSKVIPKQTLSLDENGSVKASVDVPLDTETLSLQLTARDARTSVIKQSIKRSQTDGILKLEVLNVK